MFTARKKRKKRNFKKWVCQSVTKPISGKKIFVFKSALWWILRGIPDFPINTYEFQPLHYVCFSERKLFFYLNRIFQKV